MTIHYTYECDVCHKNYDKEELVKVDRDGNNHICRYCMKVKIWDWSKKVYCSCIDELDIRTVEWMFFTLRDMSKAVGDKVMTYEGFVDARSNCKKDDQ